MSEAIEEALLWAPSELWEKANAELKRLLSFVPNPDAPAIGKFGKGYPETSRKAATALYPKSGSMRREVLDAIVTYGALGCEQVEDMLGYTHQNISARIRELRIEYAVPLVEDSGERRRNRSGKDAIVWQPTEAGRNA